jgi:hypothetical protein
MRKKAISMRILALLATVVTAGTLTAQVASPGKEMPPDIGPAKAPHHTQPIARPAPSQTQAQTQKSTAGVSGNMQGISRPPAAMGIQPAPQSALSPKPLGLQSTVVTQTGVNTAAQPQAPQPQYPLRPSQLPANAPRVSYSNGELLIVAENSSMADVISGIRSATGIVIETVGAPSSERIAAKIGPAPVRDVILSLLQGSHYDYAILSSATDPARVARVVLTQKSGTNTAQQQMAGQPRAQQPQQQIYEQPSADEEDDGNEGFAQPTPAPEPPPAQTIQVPQGQAQPNGQNPQDQTKTPEQLLEDLRRMEQERQNQQNQNLVRPERGERPR